MSNKKNHDDCIHQTNAQIRKGVFLNHREVYLAIITVEFDNETMIFDQIFRK